MMVDGKPRATLTGNEIDEMKERLIKTYFHLPTQSKPRKRKKRR